jgi:thiaminase/transcriptional activator TenA
MTESTDNRTSAPGPIPAGSLAAALRSSSAASWQQYTQHEFVRQLAAGTLPESCYRHFLIQDYLFLRHFARAYALAAYKADTLEEMRQAVATIDGLVNQEMRLHVETCAGWGIDEAEMAATAEEPANIAYTRFVLDRGLSGDLLDLLTALAPCVLGYTEIGARLRADPETKLEGNPYRGWIDLYGGEELQEVARAACAQLDRVAERRIGRDVRSSGRWAELSQIFEQATRLEIGFWDMGMAPARG